jgi:putative selenate reductase
MAELVPIPLPLLLTRAFLEYEREGKIFDLPKAKFFRGLPGLDLSVVSNGHRASTPLGPAAGPHGQLAQNIALAWLAGSRIIELKTVQVLDELKIPRPCIDIANVGYNVEWSQELKLERSLREYVSAAMFLEILKASRLLGEDLPGALGDTIFDMSAGYNLEGIQSPRVRAWLGSMKNAGAIVDELRAGLTGRWARFRDLPFPTRISDTITLSTFHGCPAEEIEGIVSFLLAEMDLHVCVKLNPTLLGMAETARLLHEALGYRDIVLSQDAFDRDLGFDEAVDLIPRLRDVARKHGKHLSVKLSNTLVVRNHRRFFADEVMYMSGAPLHVLTMNLAAKLRARLGAAVPMSFSAGVDAQNVANVLAMGFVPVTVCTDLLRPGGYGRLARYFERIGERMREVGATTISEYVLRANTPSLVEEATNDPRYRWERNHTAPRKIGSKLWLYDCIACEKCVPVCPNDANFIYEIDRKRQFANYADACNDCGNCDVFCPEDGGPNIEKPRFFSSLETYKRDAGRNGYYLEFSAGRKTLYATVAGEPHTVIVDAADRAWFDGVEVVAGGPPAYREIRRLLDAVSDPRRIHFVNAPAFVEDSSW